MSQLRSVARRVVPKPVRDLGRSAYWASRRWGERYPQEVALDRLVADHGDRVQTGPFTGMRSLTTTADGCILPKLIGCYEEEVHHWIELIISRGPRRVIDVGCASGWYSAGFAYRLPDAEVYGYDVDEGALVRARTLAELNHVADRVYLLQQPLTPSSLGELIVPGATVIVVDIDGPEIDLLDPGEDPRLLGADVLVEFHDHFNPTISSTIVERFTPTHEIQRLYATGRDPAHYRCLDRFHTRWVRDAAVAERRPWNPRQEFALMTRRGT